MPSRCWRSITSGDATAPQPRIREAPAEALAVPPGHDVPMLGGPMSQVPPKGGTTNGRWPLAAMQANFSSVPTGTRPVGSGRRVVRPAGADRRRRMFLAAVMFYTVPRPRRPAWHGDSGKTIATVGFNDQIELGGMGETMEDPQEVLQLKLVDQATGEVDPMRDDVYLRGSVVTWYSQNHWRREPPPNSPESHLRRGSRTNCGRMRRRVRSSGSALPWCRTLPWSPTWIASICSTSGRW